MLPFWHVLAMMLFALVAVGSGCDDTPVTPPACVPECTDKSCGDDGCGMRCGICGSAEQCDDAFQCVLGTTCTPLCGGKVCGPDGCGGVCGVCSRGTNCDIETGGCFDPVTCTAQCEGKACGSDLCGSVCGICSAGEVCNAGVCVGGCTPDCDGKACGGDGCGGVCGTCALGFNCEVTTGTCYDPVDCTPQCEGKVCGPDGCGGVCGSCGTGTECTDGTCSGICVADCVDKTCGVDGCGGICGICADGADCVGGNCAVACESECAGKTCGVDGCGGICGICADGADCVGGNCTAICEPACTFSKCGDDGCGGVCGTCKDVQTCSDEGSCFVAMEPCATYSNCFAFCLGGASCEAKCAQTAGTDTLAIYDEFLACGNAKCSESITDTEAAGLQCIGEQCSDLVSECLPGWPEGDATCATTWECRITNASFQGALACNAEASLVGFATATALNTCAITGGDSNPCTGIEDTDCLKVYCAAEYTACFDPVACVPDCTGKTCGGNGCGGVCGTCTGGDTCEAGSCVAEVEGLQCMEVGQCLQGCSTIACDLTCYEQAAPGEGVVYDAFETCAGIGCPGVSTSLASTFTCLAEECNEEVLACDPDFPNGVATCAESNLCALECTPGDAACFAACNMASSPTAYGHQLDLNACQDGPCSGSAGFAALFPCLVENCPVAVDECAPGIPSGTGTCKALLSCALACSPSATGCQAACQVVASPEAAGALQDIIACFGAVVADGTCTAGNNTCINSACTPAINTCNSL